MRYAPEQEIPLPPMQDGEGARILSKSPSLQSFHTNLL